MNILVIGSKGFIGSHVVDYFSKKYKVFTCDVVTDYITPDYFQILTTHASFDEVFIKSNPHVCINCSGAASVPDSLLQPERDYELNVHNTFKILDAIRKYTPTCKFIHLSSAAVYGNPTKLPINEVDNILPISPYGVNKKIAEEICSTFFNYFGLQTLSLRLFSVYGPRLQKQLFWDIYKKCSADDTITLFGTGDETRDFIYIKDLISVFDLIIQHCNFNGSTLNIGNGKEITIKSAINTFTQLIGWNGKIQFTGEQRNGDPIKWCANIEKISNLGYRQVFSLSEGLKEYSKWIQEKR